MDRTPEREARIRRVLEHRQTDLTVVLENVHDPHNAFAIARTAEAVGVPELQLLYNDEELPDFTKGKQSSAGTKKWLDLRPYETVADCYGALRARGFRIVASRLDSGARSLFDLDFTRPTAIVMGNEHRGVSDEAAANADEVFYIPMVGMVQSLNVSVACAVTLYEAFRQRHRAGLYAAPHYSAEELETLFREWSFK